MQNAQCLSPKKTKKKTSLPYNKSRKQKEKKREREREKTQTNQKTLKIS